MGHLPDEARWNTNIQYHDVLLAALPAGARRALDVGCGEGLLTRRLSERVGEVIGIDADRASIEAAAAQAVRGTAYVCGDVLDHPFEPASFDVVVCVATLHHLDAGRGLRRMRELVRPGGMVGVIGLARSGLTDIPIDLAAAVVAQVIRRRRGWYEPASPLLWPPPATFREMRRIVAAELPGAAFRRRLLWRYTVLWRKPES